MKLNDNFNDNVSLFKNIQARLIVNQKDLEDVARELNTTASTVRTIIGNKFQRGGKSTPLDKKVFDYFTSNFKGFKQYCIKNNISTIDSIEPYL